MSLGPYRKEGKEVRVELVLDEQEVKEALMEAFKKKHPGVPNDAINGLEISTPMPFQPGNWTSTKKAKAIIYWFTKAILNEE